MQLCVSGTQVPAYAHFCINSCATEGTPTEKILGAATRLVNKAHELLAGQEGEAAAAPAAVEAHDAD